MPYITLYKHIFFILVSSGLYTTAAVNDFKKIDTGQYVYNVGSKYFLIAFYIIVIWVKCDIFFDNKMMEKKICGS